MLTPGVNRAREKEYNKSRMERWLTQNPQASLRLRQWWFPLCEQYSNGRSNSFKINTERCTSGLTPGPSSFLKADSERRKLDTWGSDDRSNEYSEWKWTDGCVKESVHTFIRCHRHLCVNIKTSIRWNRIAPVAILCCKNMYDLYRKNNQRNWPPWITKVIFIHSIFSQLNKTFFWRTESHYYIYISGMHKDFKWSGVQSYS